MILAHPDFLALLRSALAAPNDTGARSALSDWLGDHGLGDLSALVAALPAWWPVVAEALATYCKSYPGFRYHSDPWLTWRSLAELLQPAGRSHPADPPEGTA